VLFKFNDAFIAAVCAGMSDEDTLGMFQVALGAGQEAISEALHDTVGEEVPLVWDGQHLCAQLDADEAEREFGSLQQKARPVYGQGFARSAQEAKSAIEKVLNAPG
jgi:hypothetical protein